MPVFGTLCGKNRPLILGRCSVCSGGARGVGGLCSGL